MSYDALYAIAQASLLTYGTDPQLRQHDAAVREPHGMEIAVLALYTGLLGYAREAKQEIGCPVGTDGYAAEYISSIAHSLRALLNMPAGRLDCATLSRAIRRICEEHAIRLDK